jgi:hypothetical protein
MIFYCIDVKKKIPLGEERGTVLRLHSALTEPNVTDVVKTEMEARF